MNPSISFLDGVPFAINPVFIQSSKKSGEINPSYNLDRAKSILNTELDFSVEAKVLTSQFHSKFTSINRKKSFSFNQFSKTSENLDDLQSSVSSSLPNTLLKYSNVPLEPIKHSDIVKSSSVMNNDSNNNNSNSIKDLFDSNTLDPFDDLELKTINELEELKKILNSNETKNLQLKTDDYYSIDNEKKLFKCQNGISANPNHTSICAVDNFGLPKLSFNDLMKDSEK